MKKIEISSSIVKLHEAYCKKEIKKEIEKLKKEFKKEESLLTDFLDKYYDKSIILKPSSKIPETQKKIKRFFEERRITPELELRLFEIYEKAFKKFSKDRKNLESIKYGDRISNLTQSNWCARLYCHLLGINICPYCNSNIIFTTKIPKEMKKPKKYKEKLPNCTTRPELDHFYPKNNKGYPLFAMNLYNLVPSCQMCNGSIKGSIEFIEKLALNPFDESIDDYVKFTIKTEKDPYNVLTGESLDYDIDYERKNNHSKAYSAAYMLEFFHIPERYAFHKGFLSNQFKKKAIYSHSYVKELKESYGIDMERDAYEQSKDVHQIFLGKLLNDIYGGYLLEK